MSVNERGEEDRGGIQVIARAAMILRELEKAREGLSLGELAGRLSLPRSTVQRIVKALCDEQILLSGKRSGVTLGPLLVRLGFGAVVDVAQVAQPTMKRMARDLGETVDLSVLRGDRALFIAHVPGTHRLSALSEVGQEFPLHSTANGKALLAAIGPAATEALLKGGLPAFTPDTVTDVDGLDMELNRARETQVTYDREEHTPGVSAIGTWFLDARGIAHALSVPVPTLRFGDGAGLVEALLAGRDEIVAAIGGTAALPGQLAQPCPPSPPL